MLCKKVHAVMHSQSSLHSIFGGFCEICIFAVCIGLFETLKTGQHKHTSCTQVIQLLHVGISVSGHHCLREYCVKASVVVSLSAVHRDSF